MHQRDNALRRDELKSYEGEFLYELQNSYELSPRLSEQILQTAKSILYRSSTVYPGVVPVVVADIEEKSGKSMENIRKRTIYVTLDDERDDLSILHQYGRTYLRQVTIQRITEEAIEQDGLLTQEDLSRLLRCSKRTIRRDIRAIQDRGVHVVTRGVFHNVGRCQTHKSQIIRLYLEGFTYSEIHRKCYHTTSSIKRYLEDFKKVLMSLHHGVTDSRNIAQVTGLSVYLVKQYRALISEAKQSPIMQDTLSIMIEQNQYMDGVKKTLKNDGLKAAVTEEQ